MVSISEGQTDRASPPAADGPPQAALRWHFRDEQSQIARWLSQHDLTDMHSISGAEPVKSGVNRDVWRLHLAGRCFYVKRYFRPRTTKRIVEIFRGTAAAREWSALHEAFVRGLPVPEPVGLAENARGGHGPAAIIVTASLPAEAKPLSDAWLRICTDRDRKTRFIRNFARFLAMVHSAGLRHGDLHVGNISVWFEDNEPKFALLDLHNAKFRTQTSPSDIITNLVQINQWFQKHASRTDRLRFLRHYCRQIEADLPGRTARLDYRKLAIEVIRKARRHARRIHARRDRRIFRTNRYFARITLPNRFTGHALLSIKHPRPYEYPADGTAAGPEWNELLLRVVDTVCEPRRTTVLKESPGRMVIKADLGSDGKARPVIIKYIRTSSPLKALVRRLGFDPLRREFATGWKLLHRDIPTALPLAYLRRFSIHTYESLLVVEFIPDSHDLDTFSKLHLPEMPPAEAVRTRKNIAHMLADTLTKLWQCGFVHRDLKAANIRIQIPDTPARSRVILVDVNGVWQPLLRRLGRHYLLVSLARLNATLTGCPAVTTSERVRFLRTVLRRCFGSDADWKQAFRTVQRISEQYRRHSPIPRTVAVFSPETATSL